ARSTRSDGKVATALVPRLRLGTHCPHGSAVHAHLCGKRSRNSEGRAFLAMRAQAEPGHEDIGGDEMEKWPLGVFASIDAAWGVKREGAQELKVPTSQLHAPHKATRPAESAKRFRDRLGGPRIRITAVFGGFEGESYADIPTVVRPVGLVPP